MKAPAYSLVLLIAATLQADPPQVRVSTLDGSQFDAQWSGITTNRQLEFIVSGTKKKFVQEDLTQIAVIKPRPVAAASTGITVFMSNGNQLIGKLAAQQDTPDNGLSLQLSADRTLRVPISSVSAIRFGDARSAFEKEFSERVASRAAGRDVLLLIKDGRVIALPGALDSLGETECSFRINDKPRNIPMRDIYAVILGSISTESESMPLTVQLVQGSRLGAKLTDGPNEALHINAGSLGKLDLAWNEVNRIDFQSGRVVFLSELTPDTRETRGIMEAVWPVNIDKSTLGGPIKLRGRSFAKGIGMHADASVGFNLDGKFDRFTTTIGIDDDAAPGGSAIFRVLVDGETKFTSPVLRGTSEPLPITIILDGAKKLTLQADMAEDLDFSDHADWANAMLIRKK